MAWYCSFQVFRLTKSNLSLCTPETEEGKVQWGKRGGMVGQLLLVTRSAVHTDLASANSWSVAASGPLVCSQDCVF